MFRKLKAVLIDLSGTLHIENNPTPNAIRALQLLRKYNLHIKFVTNTTKESKYDLHQRLLKLGFEVQENEIFSSLTSACSLVKSMNIRPFLMLTDSAKSDFASIDTENPNAVVVGLSPESFKYEYLNEAFKILLNGGPLIGINKASYAKILRYYMTATGLALAAGPFVSALEYASGQKAVIVGKPDQSFFVKSVEEFHVDPGHCVMIGDDIRDDVEGAMNAGMHGILVQTGKYRDGDEEKISPQPTCVAKNFEEAVKIIINSIQNT